MMSCSLIPGYACMFLISLEKASKTGRNKRSRGDWGRGGMAMPVDIYMPPFHTLDSSAASHWSDH